MIKQYWKFWFKGKSNELVISGEGYICAPHDNIFAAYDAAREEIKESFRTLEMSEGFPKLQKLKRRPKCL
jgi:hypothetical protein